MSDICYRFVRFARETNRTIFKKARKSHGLLKLTLYPALDFTRGLFFTLGGITQFLKTIFGERPRD